MTEWYPDAVLKALPFAAHETNKASILLPCEDWNDIDAYADLYRPNFFIPLCDMYAFKVSHSIRDFMPNFTTDFSPFAVRIRPGKRHEESSGKKSSKMLLKNPSIMMGISSASSAGSTNSTSSESDYSSSEEMNSSVASSHVNYNFHHVPPQSRNLAFSQLFGTMKDAYGVDIKAPRKSDVMLYKRFVNLQTSQMERLTAQKILPLKIKSPTVLPLSAFSKDTAFSVTPPTVSRISRDIYKNYVRRRTNGATDPGPRDMALYSNYMSKSGSRKTVQQ